MQRGFFLYNLYDREFQGIRKYQPYRLQATPGHQNRLPAPAVQAHIADRKDDVCMVYHILVPFPQTVLRIVCLQHRLLVAPLCDGEVAIPQGFRPPHRLPLILNKVFYALLQGRFFVFIFNWNLFIPILTQG